MLDLIWKWFGYSQLWPACSQKQAGVQGSSGQVTAECNQPSTSFPLSDSSTDSQDHMVHNSLGPIWLQLTVSCFDWMDPVQNQASVQESLGPLLVNASKPIQNGLMHFLHCTKVVLQIQYCSPWLKMWGSLWSVWLEVWECPGQCPSHHSPSWGMWGRMFWLQRCPWQHSTDSMMRFSRLSILQLSCDESASKQPRRYCSSSSGLSLYATVKHCPQMCMLFSPTEMSHCQNFWSELFWFYLGSGVLGRKALAETKNSRCISPMHKW